MEAMETKPLTIAEAAAQQPKPERLVFRPGELMPIKGVWFMVERVDKEGLFLKAVGFTKNREGRR